MPPSKGIEVNVESISGESILVGKLKDKAFDIEFTARSAEPTAQLVELYDRVLPYYERVREKFATGGSDGRDRIAGISDRLMDIAWAYVKREQANVQKFRRLMPTDPQDP
jgi:hypothetical protein